MRKNYIPRNIAIKIGELFTASNSGEIYNKTSSEVIHWIDTLPNDTWNSIIPDGAKLTGQEYKIIWKKLTGML